MSATATHIDELTVVQLTHDIGVYPKGAVGTVVAAHPDADAYTVEITDAQGRTVDLLACSSEDLRLARL